MLRYSDRQAQLHSLPWILRWSALYRQTGYNNQQFLGNYMECTKSV